MNDFDLQYEWTRRERVFVELVAYFSDLRAKSYAEGCLAATQRCLADLRSNGVWIKGYEAGLRAAMKERIEESQSVAAVDPVDASSVDPSTRESASLCSSPPSAGSEASKT